jgi:uncharacterized membrane protein YhdT
VKRLGRYLRGLPLKQRVLAIAYLTAIVVSSAGIPVFAIGVTSHTHWVEIVGIVLLLFLLVENAIISPIIRVRLSSRRAKLPG